MNKHNQMNMRYCNHHPFEQITSYENPDKWVTCMHPFGYACDYRPINSLEQLQSKSEKIYFFLYLIWFKIWIYLDRKTKPKVQLALSHWVECQKEMPKQNSVKPLISNLLKTFNSEEPSKTKKSTTMEASII